MYCISKQNQYSRKPCVEYSSCNSLINMAILGPVLNLQVLPRSREHTQTLHSDNAGNQLGLGFKKETGRDASPLLPATERAVTSLNPGTSSKLNEIIPHRLTYHCDRQIIDAIDLVDRGCKHYGEQNATLLHYLQD